MPLYDDPFASNAHFLAPSIASLRKSPSRQSISLRRTDASDDGPQHHSLAHELAVALMPEPSAGSKLLAEEFGIEYDDGAEGIDGELDPIATAPSQLDADTTIDSDVHDLASDASFHEPISEPDDALHQQDFDPVFATTNDRHEQQRTLQPEQDAMEVLANDLESTDKFLNHLRRLDTDNANSSTLERLASDMIRHINDTVRDREGQVRDLIECEREFRKIASQVGGNDVLSNLEELTGVEDLVSVSDTTHTSHRTLDVVEEEPSVSPLRRRYRDSMSHNDWELDPDRHHLGDEDYMSPPVSPLKDMFVPPTPLLPVGPVTPASTVPHLTHLRTSTSSLVSSLATISEQAQVTGAATSEAGRKIRALKNKIATWQTDWDSAERSRRRIERWEAGDVDGSDSVSTPLSPTRPGRRVDGRQIVAEHLRAFELSLQDATLKTQAIMAR